MKIIFCGAPRFASIVLEKLAKSQFSPILVITRPDEPVGRKQVLTPPAAKFTALAEKIKVFQPEDTNELEKKLKQIKPDMAIVAAYGRLIPKEILGIPKYGFINVHPSLLPKWRGASPIQYTVLNGDKETGVTIMQMDEIIDHGFILSQKKIKIDPQKINSQELTEKLAVIGADLLMETINNLFSAKANPVAQKDKNATYSKILTKQDGRIDWRNSAEKIERQIRAFNPWPGTFTFDGNNNLVKIFKASVQRQTGNCPVGKLGKTFLATNDQIAVQCQKDFLIIEELQLGGGKRMKTEDFLRGHQQFVGTILK